MLGKGVAFTFDRKNYRRGDWTHVGVIVARYVSPRGLKGFMVRTWIWMNTTETPVYPDEIIDVED